MLLRCLTCSPLVSFVSYSCSLAASYFSILNLVVEFGVWGLTGILFGGFFTCVSEVKLFPREEPQKLTKSVNYCTFVQHIYGRNIYIYTYRALYYGKIDTQTSYIYIYIIQLCKSTHRSSLPIEHFNSWWNLQFIILLYYIYIYIYIYLNHKWRQKTVSFQSTYISITFSDLLRGD